MRGILMEILRIHVSYRYYFLFLKSFLRHSPFELILKMFES